MVNEIYIRNCPNCNIEITYKTISARNLANREVRKCNICHRIGKGFTGKHHNKISKKKISNNLRGENNYMFGKTHSDEIKLKISENMPDQCGENNSFFGKHHSIKTKRKIGRINKNNKYSLGLKRSDASCKKMRLAAIKRIEYSKNNGLPIFPNYNPKACLLIEEYGKNNGYKFQHAMNGGELYIKDLGYWVDGYDKDKNVVIEYYEKYHKNQIKKDIRRKNEIIKYLNCQFIELKQWEM